MPAPNNRYVLRYTDGEEIEYGNGLVGQECATAAYHETPDVELVVVDNDTDERYVLKGFKDSDDYDAVHEPMSEREYYDYDQRRFM